MEILKLITTLISYLASREINYKTRTLLDLYDEETQLLQKIVKAHSNPNNSPDGAYVKLLNDQLAKTRKLREVLEAKTISS